MKKYTFLIIFGLAFALRLLYVVFSADRTVPLDEWRYYQIVTDHWLTGNDFNFTHHPPLYPLFMLIIFKVFSVSLITLQIIQCLLSALTCVLIFSIARKLSDEKTGLISALIYAVSIRPIYMPAMILSETLFTFILALTTLVFLKSSSFYRENKPVKSGLDSFRYHIGYPCFMGFLFGLLALTRSIAMGLPFVFLAYFIIRSIISRQLKLPFLLKYSFLFILIFALTLCPYVLRNYKITGRVVLASTGGGITFFWHNTDMMWATPGADYLANNTKLSDLEKYRGPFKENLSFLRHPAFIAMHNKYQYTGKPDEHITRSDFFYKETWDYLKNLSFYTNC